jgi:hypothetical protein
MRQEETEFDFDRLLIVVDVLVRVLLGALKQFPNKYTS